jgi:hypothetical protein
MGRAVILVIIYVKTFKTDIIDFIVVREDKNKIRHTPFFSSKKGNNSRKSSGIILLSIKNSDIFPLISLGDIVAAK